MQVEEFFVTWAGSLIIWFKPNWAVSNLSFKHSVLLLSFEYQLAYLVVEAPIKFDKMGLKRKAVSRFDSKLSKDLLNSSRIWLGDLYS